MQSNRSREKVEKEENRIRQRATTLLLRRVTWPRFMSS